jgi:hypothetical protein
VFGISVAEIPPQTGFSRTRGQATLAARRIFAAVARASRETPARGSASALGASAPGGHPHPAAAESALPSRRALLAILLVTLACAIGGGYLIGQAGAPDLSAAKRSSAAAGEAAGSRAGAARGFRSGVTSGRRSAYREAYRRAYRRAAGEAAR